MKRVIVAIAAAAAVPCTPEVLAQGAQGMSAGLILSSVRYEEAGQAVATPSAMGLSVEKRFGQHFGIEGRMQVGISDDAIQTAGERVDIGVEGLLGLYGKAYWPLSSSFSAYGLLGVTRGKIEGKGDVVHVASGSAEGAIASGSVTQTDVSYGVGAEISFGEENALALEWARLLAGDGLKVQGLSVRVSRRF